MAAVSCSPREENEELMDLLQNTEIASHSYGLMDDFSL